MFLYNMHVKFKGRSKEEEEFGGLCMTLYVTPMLPLFSLECDVDPPTFQPCIAPVPVTVLTGP